MDSTPVYLIAIALTLWVLLEDRNKDEQYRSAKYRTFYRYFFLAAVVSSLMAVLNLLLTGQEFNLTNIDIYLRQQFFLKYYLLVLFMYCVRTIRFWKK